LLFSLIQTSLSAQFYFTGDVKGLHGDKLPHVAIMIRSSGMVYYTGMGGDFAIVSAKADDSLTFAYSGYLPLTVAAKSTDFLRVTLQPQAPDSGKAPMTLSSVHEGPSTVSFTGYANGSSFNYISRFLDMGSAVPAEAVKIEEMLGYYDFSYEEPDPPGPFSCSSRLMSCPWNNAHRLLCLNINGRKIDMNRVPPANLVFLIDVSGSMDLPNKLPLIKTSVRSLIRNLRENDTVSIVEYGSRMNYITGLPGSKKMAIISAIEQLRPNGQAPGAEGIAFAYQVARQQFIRGGNNRLILITDGDISETQSGHDALQDLIGRQNQAGIHLTCIGVGMDDGKDSELQSLAGAGHGHFSCIKEEQEGERILLNELVEDAPAVAEHMSVTAVFDTVLVADARLLGFENKPGAAQDTAARFEGSSIGSAHSLEAIFEIVPKKDSLKIPCIARVTIHYCLPRQTAVKTVSYDCLNKPETLDKAGVVLQREACVALFGMKLKNSDLAYGVTWADVEKMARKTFGGVSYLDRQYLNMVLKARRIYERRQSNSNEPAKQQQ
jgi:Ca-activated chloride channel family protein